MPCKKRTQKHLGLQETVARSDESNKIPKTQSMHASFRLMSPRESVWNHLYQKIHEDHIAGKGHNSMSHDNLVHKSIPMLQATKIPEAEAAVDKEWKKLETIPAWQLDKVKSKNEVILEAQRDKKKVHFAILTDICYLRNAELEPEFQKHKGRVVLRGGIVKDDSGAYVVFIEQGSCASKITAATVIDVIARLLDCDGQAADAVSAYTQVKMEDAPRLLRLPKSECPDIWIRLPKHKWPKSWSNIEDPVVLLERKLYGHPLLGSCGKDLSRKFLRNLDGKNCRVENACMFIENTDYSYQFSWMISKWMERMRLPCGRH